MSVTAGAPPWRVKCRVRPGLRERGDASAEHAPHAPRSPMTTPPPLPDPTCDVTPDGTYIFEVSLPDGRRAVATVLPEEVDEIAGPRSEETMGAEEKRRRFQVARLLAEMELRSQIDEPPPA